MIDLDEIEDFLRGKLTSEIVKACSLSYYHQYLVAVRDPDLLVRYEELFDKFRSRYDAHDAAPIIQMIATYGMKNKPYPEYYSLEEKDEYKQRTERILRSRDTIQLKLANQMLGLPEAILSIGRSHTFGV